MKGKGNSPISVCKKVRPKVLTDAFYDCERAEKTFWFGAGSSYSYLNVSAFTAVERDAKF